MNGSERSAAFFKPAEQDRAEEDLEEAVFDRAQGDELSLEQNAEIDLMTIPTEVPRSTDGALPDLERIDQFRELGRKGARARPVYDGGSLLAESFVRPFKVVLVLEASKGLLLGTEADARRGRGFIFQSEVESFVTGRCNIFCVSCFGLD